MKNARHVNETAFDGHGTVHPHHILCVAQYGQGLLFSKSDTVLPGATAMP